MTDRVLTDVAKYVTKGRIQSAEAFDMARLCLMDSLGCAILALRFDQCTKLLGPIVPGAQMESGARVPGTGFQLDPVQAAFNLGAMIRWLDFNDTWLAAEWGHPSDNLGGILMAADHASRAGASLTMRDVQIAMIRAYEIQGVLALENAFNRQGLDHVLLVRIATAAAVLPLLSRTSPVQELVISALSNAWIDGGALRTYRQAPNTGSRKSWAAGDATSRGVWLALMALRGEMGYQTALSAKTWGFEDALLGAERIKLGRTLGSYVIENILFKISYPAEFHAQTAVEAAVKLHPQVRNRLDRIQRIRIDTQESAIRIIDKTGPLHNPADRDHCIQYMVAVSLVYGALSAEHYEDATAQDPRLDALRQKMQVAEELRYSRDYLDPNKRSITNAVQVFFTDGSATDRIEIEYPLGHKRRRAESVPFLKQKFASNLSARLSKDQCQKVLSVFKNPARLDAMVVRDFVDLFVNTEHE